MSPLTKRSPVAVKPDNSNCLISVTVVKDDMECISVAYIAALVLISCVVVLPASVTYCKFINPLNSLNADLLVKSPSTIGINSLPSKPPDGGKLEIGILHMAILLFIHQWCQLSGVHMQEWLIYQIVFLFEK